MPILHARPTKNICRLLMPLFFAAAALADETVNIYTDRQAVFLEAILQAFHQETGIEARVLYLKKGLLGRMEAEGSQSPADVVIAVDAGFMQDFVRAGLLQPYPPALAVTGLGADLRTDYWVAVTRRARVLYVKKGLDSVKRYEDLAKPEHKNSICVRNGKHKYNIGLFSDMIARLGEAGAREWLAGVADNLARAPGGNDRAQIKGVVSGDCAIAIANHYYYYKLAKDDAAKAALDSAVDVVFPEALHINVTGAALAKNAPHRENAVRLLQFLLSPTAQRLFASANNEFPALDDIKLTGGLADYFAALKARAAPLADVEKHRAAASKAVDAVGFNHR